MTSKRKAKKSLKRLTGATVLAAATLATPQTARASVHPSYKPEDVSIASDWSTDTSVEWKAYSPTITTQYVGKTVKVRVMPDSNTILDKDAVKVNFLDETNSEIISHYNKVASTNVFTQDFVITKEMVGKRLITSGTSKLINPKENSEINAVRLSASYKIDDKSFFAESFTPKNL